MNTDQFTILIDSREQTPWEFPADISTEKSSLPTGDYSIRGLSDFISIERKELNDFLLCCGRERERFVRELQRMRGYSAKAVIVESDLKTIRRGKYRSRISPEAVIGSVGAWTARYNVPIIFAGDREGARDMAYSMLRGFYKSMRELVEELNL